jgi:hypothetical protein
LSPAPHCQSELHVVPAPASPPLQLVLDDVSTPATFAPHALQ